MDFEKKSSSRFSDIFENRQRSNDAFIGEGGTVQRVSEILQQLVEVYPIYCINPSPMKICSPPHTTTSHKLTVLRTDVGLKAWRVPGGHVLVGHQRAHGVAPELWDLGGIFALWSWSAQ